ncbi:hypothetical protein [Isobaculum melis]|uniref:Uncharacterized protein n=1 Tax=Isobaculum melis TaxID=142588 RepID=A0A1H9PY46_9LACT|nr:hypothetical protein [Isobaculum melis]SER52745.1 hypothetical protein SAMN04488559_101204 [Isobaculum melis]
MLTLNKIVKLLNEKSIKVIVTEDKIYIDNRLDESIPIENHYGISIQDGKWSYCFYVLERKNNIQTEVLKSFINKEEAENYLFLQQINKYFINNYVIASRNHEIENWTIELVRKEMKRVGIPSNYLSYGSEIFSNSILYSNESGKWYSGYINTNNELIYKTKCGNDEQDWFLSLYGNDVYILYLFDIYQSELLDKKEVLRPFSDKEKLIVLGYE